MSTFVKIPGLAPARARARGRPRAEHIEKTARAGDIRPRGRFLRLRGRFFGRVLDDFLPVAVLFNLIFDHLSFLILIL